MSYVLGLKCKECGHRAPEVVRQCKPFNGGIVAEEESRAEEISR